MNQKKVLSSEEVLTKEEEKKFLDFVDKKESIIKTVNLSWDGSGILLRLPKDIANYFGVNEKNLKQKQIKFIIEEKEDSVEKTFEVINKDDKEE